MTGYSKNENESNMKIPHLHFGMQLIFDESQKDGYNQIWIDVYNIIELLQKNKSAVYQDPETRDYYRSFEMNDTVSSTEISPISFAYDAFAGFCVIFTN
jgi:hypothetical protein